MADQLASAEPTTGRKKVRKILIVLLAALALIVGGLGAGTASAATSSGSCTTGGTDFTFTLNHNDNTFNELGWSTDPAAKMNRLTLTTSYYNTGNGEFNEVNIGGDKDTLNDVASSRSHYQPGNWPSTFYSVRYWRVWVWGGVGNSKDSCQTPWRPIFT
jgi:hypothetical protein